MWLKRSEAEAAKKPICLALRRLDTMATMEMRFWRRTSLLASKQIDGPVNCASPHPVRNRELTKTLARVLGRRVLVPFVPGFVLKMALGEFADVVLEGQRVMPGKLLRDGFEFRYPTLRQALDDVLTAPDNS